MGYVSFREGNNFNPPLLHHQQTAQISALGGGGHQQRCGQNAKHPSCGAEGHGPQVVLSECIQGMVGFFS